GRGGRQQERKNASLDALTIAMNDPVSQLPPDIAMQIDPAWRKNQADYWSERERLHAQHEGQWIGFANGKVVVSGTSPVAVFHAAEATAHSPFVTCVGKEDEPCRIRRSTFNYDNTYPGEPPPVLDLSPPTLIPQ
ncbi:MAG TPA: hypothetical protein VFI31_10345, partial [Pirellulales bacterium]|nr:hypothetical protein [Pirellulales bacterium]